MTDSLNMITKMLSRLSSLHNIRHKSRYNRGMWKRWMRPAMDFGRSLSTTNSPGELFNLQMLQDRGLIQQAFPPNRPELPALLDSPQTMYAGFDPTADSLHVGNLLSLIVLLHGQRAGHTPLTLVGGATGMIGDPSGKSTDRVAMSAEEVENNIIKLTENIDRIFHNHQEYILKDSRKLIPHRVLNNADWYRSQNVIDFLSGTCRNFRIGDMLSRQAVQSRLSATCGGMSCTEFMYQIFQATDFLHLHQNYNCNIQIGGSDQAGNITSGFELIRNVTEAFTFGLLVPLLTDAEGKKLGKSSGNSLWLDPDRDSPHDMYQYYLNLEDAIVEKFLKIFTFLPLEEITELVNEAKLAPAKRIGQKKLAEQMCLLVHGEPGLNSALASAEVLFGKNPLEYLRKMSFDQLEQLFGKPATFDLKYDPKMTFEELTKLVGQQTGFFTGKVKKRKGKHIDGLQSNVNTLMSGGGLYVNQSRVSDQTATLASGDCILPNNATLLRLGKKKYIVVRWQF